MQLRVDGVRVVLVQHCDPCSGEALEVHVAGTVPTGRDGRTSAYLLSGYRKVREAVQPVLDLDWVNLDVRFNTMHGEG